MTTEEIQNIQATIGLSDRKMAESLGVTRQTWRNWRIGSRCPVFVQNALRWMMTIRELDPANDNLPALMRKAASNG